MRDAISSNTVCTSLHWEFKGHGQPQSWLGFGVLHIQRRRCLPTCGLKMGVLREGQHLFSLNYVMPPPSTCEFFMCSDSCISKWISPGAWWLYYYQQMLYYNFSLSLCLLMYAQPSNSLISHRQPPHWALITVQQCTLTHVVQGKHLQCWEFAVHVLVQHQRLSFHSSSASCRDLRFGVLNLQGHSYPSIWGWFRITVIGLEVYL